MIGEAPLHVTSLDGGPPLHVEPLVGGTPLHMVPVDDTLLYATWFVIVPVMPSCQLKLKSCHIQIVQSSQ